MLGAHGLVQGFRFKTRSLRPQCAREYAQASSRYFLSPKPSYVLLEGSWVVVRSRI